MAAEGQEVAIQLLYVKCHVGCALRSIDQYGDVTLMGHFDNLGHGVDGTEDVADVGDAHQSCPLCDVCCDVLATY